MVKLTYKQNTFMFTGDGGFEGKDEAEDRALTSGLNLHADVLKVGHHGSGGSSSAEFLATVGAKYGLLTTAYGSATGHPHETAMRRLKTAHVDLYQTRDLGHIIVVCDGLNYQFNSIKNGVLTENVAPSDPWGV
jgi:beta-lactamase superfamily II metal-dependent hydrolase